MLASLLGSKGSEKVLIFITARGEGYAREISQFFDMDISTIQNQLDKFSLAVFWQALPKDELGYRHFTEDTLF